MLAACVATLSVTAIATGADTDGLGIAISDERTVTRWAFADAKAPILAEPGKASSKVGRLRFATLEGQPEVYLVQRQYKLGKTQWLKIRIPEPPNGSTGWVKQESMLALNTVRTQLVIDKSALRATLFKNGKQTSFSVPIGIGLSDRPTPEGSYYIREGLDIKDDGGTYGAYAFGTNAFSDIDDWPFPGPPTIGIHGTNQPELIPGQISNGCVRMTNANIKKLKKLMPLGTPVLIK